MYADVLQGGELMMLSINDNQCSVASKLHAAWPLRCFRAATVPRCMRLMLTVTKMQMYIKYAVTGTSVY